MSNVAVEPLSDKETLLSEWRLLFERSQSGSIFLSPEWIESWLEGAEPDAELHSVQAARDGEALLFGIIGVRRSRRPPMVGPTAAHLQEFGNAGADAIYIEYNDFLVAPEAPPDIRERALGAVIDTVGPIDELVLRNARPAIVAAAERLAAARSLRIRKLQNQPCFTIDLGRIRQSGGDYLSTRSSSLRTQLRRSLRLYEERGSVALHIADDTAERAEAWGKLKELHEESWRSRGEKGVFANAAFVAFHERLGGNAPHCVELATIRAGDQIVGCLYNFVCGNRAYNYQSGFKFEADNQLKPGMVAHSLAAQHYLEKGFAAYELLAGEAQYKRRLGEETETLSTLVLELRRGIRARVRKVLRGVRRSQSNAAGTRQT